MPVPIPTIIIPLKNASDYKKKRIKIIMSDMRVNASTFCLTKMRNDAIWNEETNQKTITGNEMSL